jgi:hypothetical protein
VLHLEDTRVVATVVGPVASVERRKTYAAPDTAADGFVAFTPANAPVRQDYTLRIDGHTVTVLVREPAEARRIGGERAIATDADGRVIVPIGPLAPSHAPELGVETAGVLPWNDGAYELTVPRAPEGQVAVTVDLHGGGPIVVVNSPSHAIDAEAAALDHLRVRLREPERLRDEDFVLRYRVDADERPGALLVEPDGDATLVALLLHPLERDHEPIALSGVSIDWGAMQVSELRPPVVGPLAAGTPLVVLARVRGAVTGPVTVTARAGREPRTLVVARDDEAPAASLRALPTLWACADGSARR